MYEIQHFTKKKKACQSVMGHQPRVKGQGNDFVTSWKLSLPFLWQIYYTISDLLFWLLPWPSIHMVPKPVMATNEQEIINGQHQEKRTSDTIKLMYGNSTIH
ncbi:hypothetical protein IW262DRAFT_1292484 [Armillaria fumosa]|nr:hypothetical protein IW262DRAFT_1292484 [Armillaria fumosa]